jgi:hypothetical protein
MRAHRHVTLVRAAAVVVLLVSTPFLTSVSATAALGAVAITVGAVAVFERRRLAS